MPGSKESTFTVPVPARVRDLVGVADVEGQVAEMARAFALTAGFIPQGVAGFDWRAPADGTDEWVVVCRLLVQPWVPLPATSGGLDREARRRLEELPDASVTVSGRFIEAWTGLDADPEKAAR